MLTPWNFVIIFGVRKLDTEILYGVVFVILRLAILVQHRLVTNGTRTDRW